jgi:hypothetical protein
LVNISRQRHSVTTEAGAAYLVCYGDEAAIHAAIEVDAMLEAGDMNGAAHWRLGLQAIREMEPEGVRHYGWRHL